jgi:hypothetical protein
MNKITALFVTLLAGSALAGPFSQGNLVVVRIGESGSTTTLNNASFATFLDEYTPAGVLVQSVGLPTALSGANNRFTLGGSATSEGQLTRSADGMYLALGGYDAAPGVAAISTSTSANVKRIFARVDSSGSVDTSTSTTAFSGASIRGVVTSTGNDFWATGGNSGVQYGASLGGSSTIQINTGGTPITNQRNINIFGGQLYASNGTANRGVFSIGSGTPTTNGQVGTVLTGSGAAPSSGSPYDYEIIGTNLMYIADDSAVAGTGGLQRWDLIAGTWTRTQNWVPANNGRVRQITTRLNAAGQTVLYFTVQDSTGSSIQSLTDIGANSTFTTIAASGTNTIFRGIEFAPIPTPGSLALLGMGGLLAARRRR